MCILQITSSSFRITMQLDYRVCASKSRNSRHKISHRSDEACLQLGMQIHALVTSSTAMGVESHWRVERVVSFPAGWPIFVA